MAQESLSFILHHAQATRDLGQALGQYLSPGSLLLLQGDLGAGKTTLVQGLGLGLGIIEPIVSPTFTLVNEYHEGRIPLYHLDLYRLEPAEVASLYLEQYWDGLENPPGITAIEWSERLPHDPPAYLQIALRHLAQGREVVLTWQGEPLLDLTALFSSPGIQTLYK